MSDAPRRSVVGWTTEAEMHDLTKGQWAHVTRDSGHALLDGYPFRVSVIETAEDEVAVVLPREVVARYAAVDSMGGDMWRVVHACRAALAQPASDSSSGQPGEETE